MRSQKCSVCTQEVRWGTRERVTGWHHRETVDHIPLFGRLWTAADEAASAAERLRPRTRLDKDGIEETYTTEEHDIRKDPDATRRKARLIEFTGRDPDYVAPLSPVEIACHPVEADSFPPRSGIRQILNLIAKTDGWELRRLTHSRGPYIGSKGESLSISDSVVLGARGPRVDSGLRVAVASWRDGAFDFAYTGILKDGVVTTTPADSKALKAWIKESP